jgi:hypothetical protein
MAVEDRRDATERATLDSTVARCSVRASLILM